MIVAFVVACVAGVLAGMTCDELVRGGDPRSRRVLVAGIVGAIGGLAVRGTMDDHSLLLEVLTAVVGVLLLAFATRVRISSVRAQSCAPVLPAV